jgi:uncharacterized protein (DUF2344 family)
VYATNSGTYTASYDGHKYVNCKPNSDHSITVIFNNHGLGVGKLRVRREFFIPDGDFPDGVYNVVSNDTTDVILVEGKTEGFDVEETFRPPYVVSEGSLVPIEVVDSLDSDASDKALSANQGRILNERINVVTTDVEEINESIKDINETLEYANATIKENTNSITSNAEEINKTKANLDALEGVVAEKADASKVKQIETEVQKNTTAISNNAARLVVLEGDGEGSIKKTVAKGIAEVVANAPEDLNTLKEVADYIASDKTKANEIEKAISDLGVKDTQLENSINANATAILSKQPLLTGNEFRTINGQSIMGEGNIEIEGEGGGIDSEPTNAVIESIEPSLVSTALRKTAQVLTEDEKEQARQNIGAQQQLQLTVKDNGNIVLSNLDGETMEFMPATPSGDPMHHAYVSAGAEYNDTDDFILKDAPWKDMVDTIEDKAKWGLDVVDASRVKQMTIKGVEYNYATANCTSPEGGTYLRYFLVGKGSNGVWVEDETKVLHLPKCWYLNGLGDITNVEMLRCYEESPKNVGIFAKEQFGKWSKARTLSANLCAYSVISFSYLFVNNDNLEVPNINWAVSDISAMLFQAKRIKYMLNIIFPNTNEINVTYCNTAAKMSNAFRGATSLRGCLLRSLGQSVSFNSCGNISKPSILHAINKATPTSAITITLHPDAYARLVDDTEIKTALETKNAALEGTGGSVSLVSA